MQDMPSTAWGAIGLIGAAALSVVGVMIRGVMGNKPKTIQLQEAANSAVEAALAGYKDYIATMTAAYERRIESMSQEHEDRIAHLSANYEEKISALTAEIHSLRAEITALAAARSTSTAAVLSEP